MAAVALAPGPPAPRPRAASRPARRDGGGRVGRAAARGCPRDRRPPPPAPTRGRRWRFYDLKRFQEAFGEFEQAYLIEQDPALLYDMAQCQRKLGNNEEALHFYKTYLRRVPKGPSAVEAEKRAREIEDAMNRTKRTSAP